MNKTKVLLFGCGVMGQKIAAALQLTDPFNPIAALPVSARFLQEHYRTFGNIGLAAAAYNAGTTRVRNWLARRGKLSKETRRYVAIITRHKPEQWTAAKSPDVPQELPAKAPCEGVAELSRDAEVNPRRRTTCRDRREADRDRQTSKARQAQPQRPGCMHAAKPRQKRHPPRCGSRSISGFRSDRAARC